MHYSLLLHNRAPDASHPVSEEMIAEFQRAYAAYADALVAAGVLVAAEALAPAEASTTVTVRTGSREIHDGPFADTKEALATLFVIDVPDLDEAIAWAERCPGTKYGVVEVRPAASSFVNGSWTA